MFTVKIMKQTLFSYEGGPVKEVAESPPATYYKQCTKLIEATEVDIHTLRSQELYGISGTTSTGEKFYYYIAHPDMPFPKDVAGEDSAGNPIFGYAAYIENAAGATTEVVKFK
jgi:hypothetical protein